jgi:hypothetical protein
MLIESALVVLVIQTAGTYNSSVEHPSITRWDHLPETINLVGSTWAEPTPLPSAAPTKYYSELIDQKFLNNMSEDLLWERIEIQPAPNGTYSFFTEEEKQAVKGVTNWVDNLVDWVATQTEGAAVVDPYTRTNCKTATITTSDNGQQSTWADGW